MKLSRDFYLRDVNIIARDLIGKILVHETKEGITSGIIVETEAYRGPDDKASHTYNNKRTARTEIQYKQGGFAYIYLIYGLYYCFNVTVNSENKPEAVLIRALEPLEGISIMMTRRRTQRIKNLCNGPGKLCDALAINQSSYGADLCGNSLYIRNDEKFYDVMTSPRINIDYSQEYKFLPWRYFAADNIYVSKSHKKISNSPSL